MWVRSLARSPHDSFSFVACIGDLHEVGTALELALASPKIWSQVFGKILQDLLTVLLAFYNVPEGAVSQSPTTRTCGCGSPNQ